MKHAVVKLGCSILRGTEGAADLLDILDSYEGPLVAVVSALKGVTDRLARAADDSIDAVARGLVPPDPRAIVSELRGEHLDFAEALDAPSAAFHASALRMDCLLARLASLLEKGDPRYRDEILAMGERLSATLTALALVALRRPARIVEPPELGLAVSEGSEGPYVDLTLVGPRIKAALSRYRDAVVPGFYGIGDDGRVRLLGRGGTDYSAALVAAALEARSCDLVMGARAIALGRGPAGAARITVACCGNAASCAAIVIGALEAGGIPIRAFAMGPKAISFSVVVDGSKAEAGLKLAHEVLFETKTPAMRSFT